METSSLQKNKPHLEAILGPLSDEGDSRIRTILAEVDEVLLEIAHHFGHERAGWDGTGLELTWMASGQVAVSSNVGASSSRGCIDFCIELRPSWYYGDKSSTLTWEVELAVTADCSHAHHSMQTVHEETIRIESAVEAAHALLLAVRKLQPLATEFPIEHWLDLASDHR